MHKFILLLAIGLGFTSGAIHAQFWGAKAPKPIDTPKDSLKKGEFTWAPQLSPEGPIVVTVSLDEQLAYTYRNGVLIGVATASTGKAGYTTPTGVFVTTLKDAKHRSSKYNNASMPYTQRITNYGVALHAGGIPGYPSSHGCIHLPSEYARLLFNAAPLGMTVVVTNQVKFPAAVDHPSFLSPVYKDGKIQEHEKLSATETYRWTPELSKTGPVSVLISGADKRLVVMRNGIEIGRCKINIVNESDSLGTHIYVAHELSESEKAVAPNDKNIQVKWLAFPLEDVHYVASQDHPLMEGRIKIPDAFLQELGLAFVPGTHVMVTDAPILAGSSGKEMAIISSHPEANKNGK